MKANGLLPVIFSLLSSSVFSTDYYYNGQPFSVQGHRGALGLVGPGNTERDIQAGIQSSADSFEVDLQVTADDVVVMGHDDNIDITCDYRGAGRARTTSIAAMTYDEFLQWDCSSQEPGIQPYPELMRVLDTHLQGDFLINLEIKPSSLRVAETIFSQVDRYNRTCGDCLVGRLRVSSFNWDVLRYAQREYQQAWKASIGALSFFASGNSIRNASQFADVFSPNFRFVSARTTTVTRQAGMKLIPYTVNRLSEMRTALSWGVDGLITDYPNRLAVLVNTLSSNYTMLPSNISENLIDNASAENGLNSWSISQGAGTFESNLIVPREGNYLFSLDSTTTTNITQSIELPRFSNREMFFQGYLSQSLNGANGRLLVEYLDRSGRAVAIFDSFDLALSFADWHRLRDQRVIPDSATRARISLTGKNRIAFDDLYLGVIAR